MIIDLATNQEQSLAQQFVSAIQTIVIDSIATVQAIWDGIVLSNKNQFFGKPGEIKDGPEDYKRPILEKMAALICSNIIPTTATLNCIQTRIGTKSIGVEWKSILSPNIPGNWPLCGCNVNINIRIWRRNHVFYV